MRKLCAWLEGNILKIGVLFLLFFIPLWPKIPLLDVAHTWVYIRLEDIVVLSIVLVWVMLILRRKITLETPLTLPILLFWIIGGISTIHSVLLILPGLANVFPNVALLSYLRRIEYMSLFFIAYAAMEDRRLLPYVITVLAITLFLVFLYGLGQKFLGFPAYLTMNEEFAKGLPVRLSPQSRISSTFGGHYDLAAYLVLVMPLLTSTVFGFKNRLIQRKALLIKLSLLMVIIFGFILLFMTVSRISFFVLLLSLAVMLLFQNRKLIILLALSVITLTTIILISFSPSLWQRFGNTVKAIDVLINAETGDELGQVQELQAKDYENKVVKMKFFQNKDAIKLAIQEDITDVKIATTAGIIPSSMLPSSIPFLIEPNAPTGENLPQGTGYINLSLAPIVKKTTDFLYANQKLTSPKEATISADFFMFRGNFLVKRALAYDLSLTTRFQGEWPRAIKAFTRNIIFGSGYSTVGLAVDNNYLRLLGEVGFPGFFLYLGIFTIVLIYIRKILPRIDSPLERSFIIGFAAGLFGLALNAIFIDVFEASKVAFLLWLLTGITLGILSFYQKNDLIPLKELKQVTTSTYAIIIYLFMIIFILFSPIFKNYFLGDDFTWLRWVADRKSQSIISTIINYFFNADGFFYRPGTKVYFLLMYLTFWLNQTVYYIVSVFLHFLVTILVLLISKKILKDFVLSILAAFLFLLLSGYFEAVFWISTTGSLFTAIFILLGLFFYIQWEEKHKPVYFWLSLLSVILSPFFQELGIIAPLVIILYRFCFRDNYALGKTLKNRSIFILLLPTLAYLGLRLLANSHWFNGDYSYNLWKLPYNFVGNVIGYLALTLIGPSSLPFYQILRSFFREYIIIGLIISIAVVYLSLLIYRHIIKRMPEEEKKIITFSFLFFIITLLPFLGLGNIASRYSYLSSVGFILLFVFLVKKLYEHLLLTNGRYNALAVVFLTICLFSLSHLIQLQKVQQDWYEASEKTKKFIISANGIYSDYLTKETARFYFVNVPIRQGDAWVFPTGLTDALWFIFHNQNLHVYQSSSVDQVFKTIEGLPNEKVFEFDSSGGFIERKKCQILPCVP